MPELRIERTFSVPYLPIADRWSAVVLNDARRAVMSNALSVLQKRATTAVSFSVGRLESLEVTVAVRETVVTTDQIAISLFDALLRTSEDVLAQYGRAITAAAMTMATAGQAAPIDSVYLHCGLRGLIWDTNDHLFQQSARTVVASIVSFDTTRDVAAAVRRPDRLHELVTSAVIDRCAVLGRRPYELRDCNVDLVGRALRISSRGDLAEEAARALLGAPASRPSSRRVVDTWPPPTAPYWASGNLAAAFTAILLSPAPILLGWLVAAGFVTGMVVLATVAWAHRNGVNKRRTLLGLTPAVVVVGFAVFYGCFATGDHPSVSVGGSSAPHLVDLYLLSFGIASTGGFFDVGVHGRPVRIAALVEMLTMVSVAGGSLYVASRAVWTRMADVFRRREGG
jgi:hypothetical protein